MFQIFKIELPTQIMRCVVVVHVCITRTWCCYCCLFVHACSPQAQHRMSHASCAWMWRCLSSHDVARVSYLSVLYQSRLPAMDNPYVATSSPSSPTTDSYVTITPAVQQKRRYVCVWVGVCGCGCACGVRAVCVCVGVGVGVTCQMLRRDRS